MSARCEFERLVEAIAPGTTLVACSLVQMQTGRNAPLRAIVERAAEVGARVLLDATQGIPFVPLGDLVDRIDYLLCSAYKHLLCPRGVAFMAFRDDRVGHVAPILANWRAADRPYGRFFGGPLTLAPDAAMYDVSLAWFPWLGSGGVARAARPLAGGRRARGAAAPGPRARGGSRAAMGREHPRLRPDRRRDRARAALAAAGIRAAFRGTGIRLSPHVYNDAADIARAVEALAPVVAR